MSAYWKPARYSIHAIRRWESQLAEVFTPDEMREDKLAAWTPATKRSEAYLIVWLEKDGYQLNLTQPFTRRVHLVFSGGKVSARHYAAEIRALMIDRSSTGLPKKS